MIDKYNEALDNILYEKNGKGSKKYTESIRTLRCLIDDYFFMHEDDMRLALEGQKELDQYKKAFDRACDIIAHARLSFSEYHDTKEDWKEYLLSEVSK